MYTGFTSFLSGCPTLILYYNVFQMFTPHITTEKGLNLHDCTIHLLKRLTRGLSSAAECQTHSGAPRPRAAAAAAALAGAQSWRWEFVLRTRRSDAWVFHQCVQQFNLSRREKHRLALITAQFRQVPGRGWKWTSSCTATPGSSATLHPLIKETVFLQRSYNVSRVQPVHYKPLLPSSLLCGSGRSSFIIASVKSYHCNSVAWNKVKFSSKLSSRSKYKFLTSWHLPNSDVQIFNFHQYCTSACKKRKTKHLGSKRLLCRTQRACNYWWSR